MNIDSIWENFLIKIKENVNSLAYDTWFKDTKLIELEEKKALVLVPTHVHKKHLSENYNELIEELFNMTTGTIFFIDYITEDEIKSKVETDIVGVPIYDKSSTGLNSKYTFESYSIGESNNFAYAASLAVAENPGKMYNPLFIYGKSGVGKTHLMHAIGNYISKNSNHKVLYVTSEQFINDFISINRKDENNSNFNSVELFKNKYRNIDVLIIDDIQFLSGATQTQHEFFHTFNTLYDSNKQIIISSDRSPDDLKILEDRLRTRFCWGLTVNILPPDLKLRRDIVNKKIRGEGRGIDVPDDVIEYISNNLNSDVRQLEGAITRIYAYATMFNVKNITLDVAIDALKDFINKSICEKNKIGQIQRIVADFYKVSIDDLKGKKKNSIYTYPRQIAMYLSRNLTDESYPRIGIEFGGRDHSTVMHAVVKIDEDIKNNQELKNIVDKLKNSIT